VPPEQVLFDADMVPAKPEGWEFRGNIDGNLKDAADFVLPEAGGEEWNWDVIEAERLRGLKFAENFAALDGLHDFFDGGRTGALGEYADL